MASYHRRPAIPNELPLSPKTPLLPLMSESPKNSRWELRLTLFFFGLLIGLLGAAAVFVLLPRQYRPSTTLQIRSTIEPDAGPSSASPPNTSSESINLEAQMEIIRSKEILEPVITAFQLGQKWGTAPEKTFNRLRHATTVKEIRNTELVQISVLDPDPKLAADLTNAIGGEYQKLRVKDQGQRALHLLNQLQTEVDDQRRKTDRLLEQMVDQTRDQLRPDGGDPRPPKQNCPRQKCKPRCLELRSRFGNSRKFRRSPRRPVFFLCSWLALSPGSSSAPSWRRWSDQRRLRMRRVSRPSRPS